MKIDFFPLAEDRILVLSYPFQAIGYKTMHNIYSSIKSVLPDKIKLIVIPDFLSLKQCSEAELMRIKESIEEMLKEFNK